MQSIINNAYSDETRLKAAHEVFASALEFGRMQKALGLWDVFVPFPPPRMLASQGEVEYVEQTFETLRLYAFEWHANHCIKDLYARLAALEKHVGLEDRS